MTTFLKRYTDAKVVEQGWSLGTSLENRVALLLAKFGHGPGVISQQHRIGRFRADFAHVAKRIVIEADGWQHRSPEGAAKDAERDAWLRSEGWLVLRVDDRHGEESLINQVARIARLLHEHTWEESWR